MTALLYLNKRASKYLKLAIAGGMTPLKAFLCKLTNFRLLKFPREAGNSPVKLFSAKFNTVKNFNRPIEAGILPDNLFLCRLICMIFPAALQVIPYHWWKHGSPEMSHIVFQLRPSLKLYKSIRA